MIAGTFFNTNAL